MSFKFIDLFCGIGGFHYAMKAQGGECVFASDIDKHAQLTYFNNHGLQPHGDITKIEASDIPGHDILCGGFPCQAFSLAGKQRGFDDTRGTLFFDIARILKEKQPKAFILENVKNLKSHDKGNTFKVIISTLEELGYFVTHNVVSASNFVPQKRERIFIVGFRNKEHLDKFDWAGLPDSQPKLRVILHQHMAESMDPKYQKEDGSPLDKYTCSDRLWSYLQAHAKKHASRGNGFGFGLVTPDEVARTISARYYKDGSEILIFQEDKNPRKLTPREASRLMGYPESFQPHKSDTQAYKQAGNSVVVPLVTWIANKVVVASF